MKLVTATATSGFFQPQPVVPNQYRDDVALRRAVSLFTPPETMATLAPDLERFGNLVLSREVLAHVVNAEHDLPYVIGSGFTAFGHPNADALVTSSGWKELQDIGIREQIVGRGYDHGLGPYARLAQYYKLHLWNPSSAVVTCPSAMQDGAINVLARDLLARPDMDSSQRSVFTRALERLLSNDPREAWTSGQWMTERPGGSDVAGTETVATLNGPATRATDVDGLPLGPWSVSGFKWFSSATDCGCVVLLAKTDTGGGSLSCFFAPTRKIVNDGCDVEMNGIRISRLKNKLGTKALPTAEVEVKDMRAWMIGEEGSGVKMISTLLNITRFYNAGECDRWLSEALGLHTVSAVGFLGRSLGVVRAFARVRPFPSLKPPHNKLVDRPLFAKTIAGVTLQYRADLLFTGLVAALLGASDSASQSYSPLVPDDHHQSLLLLRILTPVVKAYTAKHAIAGVQECMESLGGVGYMENVESPEMNLARIFRDTNVLAIWEGTTDVLSTDTVKVLHHGRDGHKVLAALDSWFEHALPAGSRLHGDEKAAVHAGWKALRADIPKDKEHALSEGREILRRIGDLVCAALLVVDAERDGDEVAAACATRFAHTRLAAYVPATSAAGNNWHAVTKEDMKIAFDGHPVAEKHHPKL